MLGFSISLTISHHQLDAPVPVPHHHGHDYTAGADWESAVFALLLGAPLKQAPSSQSGTGNSNCTGAIPRTCNKISFMYSQTMSPALSISLVAWSLMSGDFKELRIPPKNIRYPALTSFRPSYLIIWNTKLWTTLNATDAVFMVWILSSKICRTSLIFDAYITKLILKQFSFQWLHRIY